MNPPASAASRTPSTLLLLLCVALLSAALMGYEIVLMRRLLIERWHHFGYLVISVALLGFGASGTLLALLERRVRARPDAWLFALAVSLLLTLAAAPYAAAQLPVRTALLPHELWAQVGWWSLYWTVFLLPFLFGAAFIGAALLLAAGCVGPVYAANLVGSAAGGVGAALLLARCDPRYGFAAPLVFVLASLVLLAPASRRALPPRKRRVVPLLVLVGLTTTAMAVGWPVDLNYDEYKYAALLQRLAAQGSARRVAAASDPHGYVELYESNLFHDLPFAPLTTAPPPMYRLIVNGDPAGSVLRISEPSQATVMDGTLMALPYELLGTKPRVLLLGEAGGTNAWLARRRGAARIDIVQPNRAIIDILQEYASPLFEDPRLHVIVRNPRAFVSSLAARGDSRARKPPRSQNVSAVPDLRIRRRSATGTAALGSGPQRNGSPRHASGSRADSYDLIQIVSLEGLGIGSSGLHALAEDHLLTVEGLADCLRALRPDGMLVTTRGIQQPPRENVRLFATLVEALERIGTRQPERYLIQVRDYLGVCTIALRSPLDASRRQRLRAAVTKFQLTPVWYDGIRNDEINRPDRLPGPPGSDMDWLHYAARRILSPQREEFYKHWLANVRPPRDDSPFFWDMYRRQSIAELRRAYGPLWLTRAELGRLFLYASMAIAGVAAVVLILLPLAACEWRGPPHNAIRTAGPGAIFVVLYFAGIGLGFMLIEMALISRCIRWLGDPVLASALVIGGVLLLSGTGSATFSTVLTRRPWLAPALVTAGSLALYLLAWRGSDSIFAPALFAAMLAFTMGGPLPAGLTLLHARAPRLVPWAWGVNGVASVLATSAAIAVAMTAGYQTVMLLSASTYALSTGAAFIATRRATATPPS